MLSELDFFKRGPPAKRNENVQLTTALNQETNCGVAKRVDVFIPTNARLNYGIYRGGNNEGQYTSLQLNVNKECL